MSSSKLQLPTKAGENDNGTDGVQSATEVLIGGKPAPKNVQLPVSPQKAKEPEMQPQMQAQVSTTEQKESTVETTEDEPSLEQNYINFKDKFTKFQNDCMERVKSGATSPADMKKEMSSFYQEEVMAYLKNVHAKTLQAECDKIRLDEQIEVLFQRRQKADLVKQRYEVLAREYNDQNKQFATRHDEITRQERDKRESIQKGFEDHLAGIKTQLDEENKKNQEAIDEIDKENTDLAGKYEELKKEIEDKSQQMTDQLIEKKKTANEIQEQITSQIDQQEAEIKKQGEAYSTQHAIKLEEEKKLIEVLKEYRSKSKEFEKATKKSRQSYNQFEKDIKALEKKIKALEGEKKKAEKIQAGKQPANVGEIVDKLEKDWATERDKLGEQRDGLKAECAQLQEKIKNLK